MHYVLHGPSLCNNVQQSPEAVELVEFSHLLRYEI